MTADDRSTSAYLPIDFETPQKSFTEVTPLPSPGYCDLYHAKRYGRWFLLKCLKEKHTDDPAHQQLLHKEFDILMRLQHPAVLQAVSLEPVALPDRRQTVCLVAEWIDGMTLSDYLATNPPQDERRRIAHELAEAVAYIHSQQVVHRDLKPSNIMVTHNGHYLKIIDFGLADTDSHAILKQPAGSLRYMAPEQMQQAVADVRNDIYSIGVILQEMQLHSRIYNKVAGRCLRPIHQRYQNMEELLSDLHGRQSRHWQWYAAGLVVLAIIAAMLLQIRDIRRKAAALERHTAELNLQMRILNHEIISFEDPVVKSICVNHWDRNGDHELSIDEAAAVTSLGAAFSGNTAIRHFDELKYFTGLTEIEASTFERCTHLESVRLPSTVQTIGENAFLACDIRSLYIPARTTRIASTSFGSDWHLAEVVVSPDNPVYDSREQCNAIIETRTNQMLTGSTTAFIPRSVTSLSDECFKWFNRPELTLPAQITRIGPWSLTSVFQRVYCESPVPPLFDSQGGQAYIFPPSVMGFPEPEIYVPLGSTALYQQAEGWHLFAHRLREYPAPRPAYTFQFSLFPTAAQKEPIWTKPLSQE